VPAVPTWLIEPLWDQFAALLPPRDLYVSTHPWGCHRRRTDDRIVFDKLIQCCGSAAPLRASPTAAARRRRHPQDL
jgi:hypothetical protein